MFDVVSSKDDFGKPWLWRIGIATIKQEQNAQTMCFYPYREERIQWLCRCRQQWCSLSSLENLTVIWWLETAWLKIPCDYRAVLLRRASIFVSEYVYISQLFGYTTLDISSISPPRTCCFPRCDTYEIRWEVVEPVFLLQDFVWLKICSATIKVLCHSMMLCMS